MKINKKIIVGCSFVTLTTVPVVSEANIGTEILQQIKKKSKSSKTAEDVVEVTLNDGESLQDRISEIQNKTSVKIITVGDKTLSSSDFTALKNANMVNLDLSEAKATSIPKYAFQQKRNLESIILPSNIERIEGFAFDSCSNLNTIVLDERIKYIGEYAFRQCSSLKGDLIIPDSVTELGQCAFYCSGYDGRLVIGSGLTKIANSAFACTGLKGELVIPENITKIENSAFDNCTGFTGQLVIPETVTEVGANAFQYCTGFTGALVIPNSITSMNSGLFYGCDNIDTVILGPNIESIEPHSYYDISLAGDNKDIYMQVNPNILDSSYVYNVLDGLSYTQDRIIVELPFNFNPEGTWVNYEGEYYGTAKKSFIDIKNITSDGEVNVNNGDTTEEVVIRISDNTDFNALNLKLNGQKIELSEDTKEYTLTQGGRYEFSRTFKNGDIETITFNIDNPYEGFEEVGVAIERALLTRNPVDISIARELVNNIDDNSSKKAEFQNILNNISVDMTFDVKNASANVDVYIKSENMLSLSLNTNSITFDDFGGTEDLVKENAVTLTVNSSLPYKVDAYLATEIQNSNKNKTMDKEILNIKANGTDEYKTFTDVATTPITLFDAQEAGNDKTHGIDIMLKGGIPHEKDIYKTTIKFEATQK
ncbi:MAG: leucine-rich repeat domain-containing protein [Clostridium sp.]|nr:leucine-rich repeat domain-containing protein [Clostridium sp.]